MGIFGDKVAGEPRSGCGGRFRRSVPVVAALATLGLAACDPALPADGRDLGVTVDGPVPSSVEEGAGLELSGSITNHGTAPASGVTFDYGVAGGFTVDDVELGDAAVCAAESVTHTSCTLVEALEPGSSVTFTVSATAGEVSGSFTHVIGAGSDTSEPDPDPNPGILSLPIEVRPAAGGGSPVELGNGTNYLGTGHLLAASGTGRASEGFTLATNTYCSDKVNGDRFQSSRAGDGQAANPCTGPLNAEYDPQGYVYEIEVPSDRSSPLDVLLWDARYDPTGAGAVDLGLSSQASEPFRYTLHGADATPLDDSDNPVLCDETFTASTPFDHGPYLGSARWNRLCTISPAAPSGRYLLRVRNAGAESDPVANGSNQFGIVAAYGDAGADVVASLCDRATRADCPVVRALGVASLQVGMQSSVVRVPLGSIDPTHEGRRLRVELFDPGEGMSHLRLLGRSSTGDLTPVSFNWSSDAGSSGSGTALDVTQGRFNGRLVTIEVDLTGYQPPAGSTRWMVEYHSTTGAVTDRTTWVAAVVDQPAA